MNSPVTKKVTRIFSRSSTSRIDVKIFGSSHGPQSIVIATRLWARLPKLISERGAIAWLCAGTGVGGTAVAVAVGSGVAVGASGDGRTAAGSFNGVGKMLAAP